MNEVEEETLQEELTGEEVLTGEASRSEEGDVQQELREAQGNYLRALADLENYRKRSIKERSDLLKYQGERIFLDMLDVFDNLELAINHSSADPEKLREGVVLIHKMMSDIFERWEVRAQSGVGQPFDPSRYNAISQMPAEGQEPGTILNELKKAFMYKDKLLRPGEVVVVSKAE